MTEEWATATEIASLYEVSRPTVSRWIERKGWPYGRNGIRNGRRLPEYPLEVVAAFLEENGLPSDRTPQAEVRRLRARIVDLERRLEACTCGSKK